MTSGKAATLLRRFRKGTSTCAQTRRYTALVLPVRSPVSMYKTDWRHSVTRRNALHGLAGFVAGSPLLQGQQDPFHDHSRVPWLDEMVTVFDFEPVAYAKVAR